MSLDTHQIKKDMIAGFIGTVAMSAAMMVKKMMGAIPELDPIHMISSMMNQKMGLPDSIFVGWTMHFVIGAILWGSLFAILNEKLPGKKQTDKGMFLAAIAWLLMMIGPMPMSGAGLFAIKMGGVAAVATFMMHMIFGAVMGGIFGVLNSNESIFWKQVEK